MNKPGMRLSELVAGIIVFEIGSTTVFLLGVQAKQDAWLAMGIAAALGFLLLLLFLAIHRKDPDRDLFDLCRTYFGKGAGTLIGLLFACYCLFESSRNTRDMGEMTVITILEKTPMNLIMAIVVLVVAFAVYHGVEAVYRSFTILFPVIAASYFLLIGFIAGMGLIHFENMLPVLENGIKPVWDTAVPELISFPFGQMVLFLVYFPLLVKKDRKRLNGAVLIAYGSVALFLICINQLNILVLGPEIAENSAVPLLQTVQLVQIARVFERLDVIFTLLLFVTLAIKMTAFNLAAVIGLERMTGIESRIWVMPVAAAIYAVSFASPNYTHYLWTGQIVAVKYAYPAFQIGLPVLLFVVMLFQPKKGGDRL